MRQHYIDEGSGAPLLMVHGNPTWSFLWRRLITAFRDGHRVVAVDHVGCGLSDKPQGYPYRLEQHIENLQALVEGLGLRDVTLVAHDWGGAIGLGTALRLPERFTRLVLLNTGAFPPPFVPLRIRLCRTPVLGSWAVRRLNAFARAALWMAVENPGQLTPAIRAGLLAPYDSWAHRVAIDGFVKDIPLTRRHPTWRALQRIEAGLPGLADRPVQLVWGMRDWCFRPSCLERLRRSFPAAEVEAIEDAGHYVTEDAPDRVRAAIARFLARTSPAPQAGTTSGGNSPGSGRSSV